MTETSVLFTPARLGAVEIPNRVLMAPMTRSRAGRDGVPGPLAALYYAQRAGAGLIVTEATQVTPEGQGYIQTPGIHDQAQVAGWRKVTDAVHAAGGRIFLQLWHVGRVSHESFQPGGALPVSASAVPLDGQAWTYDGMKPHPTPRALATEEIPGVVAQFRKGAELAKEAGFDGVEIHGANGYLIDQFLRDGTNQRTDRYGGSAANRARFLLEVTEAVVAVWGADRVGVRLSPLGAFNGMSDSDPDHDIRHGRRSIGRLRPRLPASGRAVRRAAERGAGRGHQGHPRALARPLHRQRRLRRRHAVPRRWPRAGPPPSPTACRSSPTPTCLCAS